MVAVNNSGVMGSDPAKEGGMFMIITDNSYRMESARRYEQKESLTASYQKTTGSGTGFLSLLSGGFERNRQLSLAGRSEGASADLLSPQTVNLRQQFSTLNYLFRIFLGNRFSQNSSLFSNRLSQLYGMNTTVETYTITSTYEESEKMTFSTKGTIKTADGRDIDFNVDVVMSRSFYEESNAVYMRESSPMIDPLVINLDGNADVVSDQTFYFDLDCDGKDDEVFNLAKGSGFLALDINGDGTINDGSELFGARTGDGFMELSKYDSDGNGWIDEADEIFNRLRVMSVDADGNIRLYSLKESDVGAICLSSIDTQYSVKNEDNDSLAQIKRSGFFLHEKNGDAGVMHQVDLAMKI